MPSDVPTTPLIRGGAPTKIAAVVQARLFSLARLVTSDGAFTGRIADRPTAAIGASPRTAAASGVSSPRTAPAGAPTRATTARPTCSAGSPTCAGARATRGRSSCVTLPCPSPATLIPAPATRGLRRLGFARCASDQQDPEKNTAYDRTCHRPILWDWLLSARATPLRDEKQGFAALATRPNSYSGRDAIPEQVDEPRPKRPFSLCSRQEPSSLTVLIPQGRQDMVSILKGHDASCRAPSLALAITAVISGYGSTDDHPRETRTSTQQVVQDKKAPPQVRTESNYGRASAS